MAIGTELPTDERRPQRSPSTSYMDNMQSDASAVSWGAIIAGAAAAAALSLVMLFLGTGLGLSVISPWDSSSWVDAGNEAKKIGVSTILWITLTQLLASALGGYLAGRLRTKWIAIHSDEVYFRDTAHGFLAWGVATLTTATLLASVMGSIVSSGVQAGATIAGGAASSTINAAAGSAAAMSADSKNEQDQAHGPLNYFVESLFRRDASSTALTSGSRITERSDQGAATTAEVARIFLNSMSTDTLPEDDVKYVGQVVAQRTGITQQEAEKRVTDTFARIQTKLEETKNSAKEMADKARKASASAALWMVVALLAGAFVASWAAVYGGRRRDL